MSKKIAFSAVTLTDLTVGCKVYIVDNDGIETTGKVTAVNLQDDANGIMVCFNEDIALTPRTSKSEGQSESFYLSGKWLINSSDCARIVAFKKPKVWKTFVPGKTELKEGMKVKLEGAAGTHKGIVTASSLDGNGVLIKIKDSSVRNPSGGNSPREDGSWSFTPAGQFDWVGRTGYLAVTLYRK